MIVVWWLTMILIVVMLLARGRKFFMWHYAGHSRPVKVEGRPATMTIHNVEYSEQAERLMLATFAASAHRKMTHAERQGFIEGFTLALEMADILASDIFEKDEGEKGASMNHTSKPTHRDGSGALCACLNPRCGRASLPSGDQQSPNFDVRPRR